MLLDGHGDRLGHRYGDLLRQDAGGGDAGAAQADRKWRIRAESAEAAEAVAEFTDTVTVAQTSVQASLILRGFFIQRFLYIIALPFFGEGEHHKGTEDHQLQKSE